MVTFISGEGRGSVLRGFTITNGSGTVISHSTYGGGIYCRRPVRRMAGRTYGTVPNRSDRHAPFETAISRIKLTE